MQICEYFFENACYSVTKYYLCKQNNKRSLLGRKQRHQVVRSFPNRYLFSLTNKVTCLFPISCILEIILVCKSSVVVWQKDCFCRARAKRMGQKNNVKESIVPVFYIIIYRVSSQYIMLMKKISQCFQKPIALSLSA